MTAHEVFIVLGLIVYIVFFTSAVYAIRSLKTTPMLVELVISGFLNLMISLTK